MSVAIKRGWILMQQERAKRVWNPNKNRHETWVKGTTGDWLLVKGEPIHLDEDDFVCPAVTSHPAIYGIRSELQWWVTGKPNPTGANFAQINTLGGGLLLKTRSGSGKWIAIHYGDIYPLSVSLSPHLYLRSTIDQLTNAYLIAGLVGATNKPSTGSAHSEPDDGIFIRFDTDVDGKLRSVTKSGGSETPKILGDADLEHHNYCVRVNDDGDEVEFLMDGVVIQTHTSGENLPTGVALQPYYNIMTRTGAIRSAKLHHYIQLFDALWV